MQLERRKKNTLLFFSPSTKGSEHYFATYGSLERLQKACVATPIIEGATAIWVGCLGMGHGSWVAVLE